MQSDIQPVMEHQALHTSQAPDSTLKTILLHVQDDETLDGRIENALALARTASAHLTCLHVTPIQAYVASLVCGVL